MRWIILLKNLRVAQASSLHVPNVVQAGSLCHLQFHKNEKFYLRK